MAGMAVVGSISAPRSWVSCARVLVTSEVSAARPSAAAARWTTVLNAPAPSTSSGGTAAMPPVMIGIMARPIPTDRSASSHTTLVLLLSSVTSVSMYVPTAVMARPMVAEPARADAVVELPCRWHDDRHHQRLWQQEQPDAITMMAVRCLPETNRKPATLATTIVQHGRAAERGDVAQGLFEQDGTNRLRRGTRDPEQQQHALIKGAGCAFGDLIGQQGETRRQ